MRTNHHQRFPRTTQLNHFIFHSKHAPLIVTLAVMLLCTFAVKQSFAASDYRDSLTREAVVKLDDAETIELQLPPGDIAITHTIGSELRAGMTITCRNRQNGCNDRLDDIEFQVHRVGSKITLETNKGMRSFAGSQSVEITIVVPEVANLIVRSPAGDVNIENIVADTLRVNLKAGDLNVKDLSVCPFIDQGAGDIDISLPYHLVSDVEIDVGIGDATMRTPENIVTARRSWLIGAEINWESGNQGCSIVADLQAGDVSLELTD